MRLKLYIILLMGLLPYFLQGQSKVTAPATLWPELQLNYGAGDAGILFVRNQYRINTDSRYNDLKSSGILSNFERVQLAVGYEHTLTEHWRGGAILRYAIEDFPKALFATAFLRHNGNIGSLYFNKQGMFEYVLQEKSQEDYGRWRILGELGKRLPVKDKFLTPALLYELFILSDFGNEEQTAEERSIDRTRLRLSLNYELTPRFHIAPYFMRQTDYYYVLIPPVYDENNNLVKDGYTTKRNRITPVFGLELKYNLNLQPNTASIAY
ncbi:DUF2490 domain-containing protein [Pontibacter vulgaris]|uniref:DUF2490 domain-containing protein n=1 Tax=Pontibacter vulgaris TaxID=2905679 RepID=UPI001FA80D5E|nr:DUF2490 domain-containing protein [Pontibacter vulgaris]